MKILRDESLGGKGKLHLSRFTIINARGEEIPVELTPRSFTRAIRKLPRLDCLMT